ncbi:MAG: hypothetical protein RLZZ175_2086 [Bacteroidota bacterium]|jgi:parallel beta-helix repeat protein
MKKLSLAIVALFTTYFVSAQTFTVTNIPSSGQADWALNGLALSCPQSTTNAITSGTFIEGIQQANLGRIKQIVFDPSVSVVDFTGRWQQTTQLCADGVSIIGPTNRVVTIIGASGASYKTLTITGKNDTISNLTFQNAYIELNGTASVISNNNFTTNQEIGSVFIFNAKYNIVKNNTFSSTVVTGGNSAIRIGTNQAENVVGNSVGDKIINNTVRGFWNGLQAGQWKQVNPKCDSLLVRHNKFYGNRNAGAYIINSVGTLIDSNYIYSNLGGGLFVEDCKFSEVYANSVGLDSLGTVLGNKGNGINVNGGNNIKVGDFVKGANIVLASGNSVAGAGLNNAIAFDKSPLTNLLPKNSSVRSNFVGVKSDGTGDLSTGTMQCGIYFGEMSTVNVLNDTIGGFSINDGNTIGYFGQIGGAVNSGIQVNMNCSTVLIGNNFVGISKTGLPFLNNQWDGIAVRGVTKVDIFQNRVGNGIQGIAFRNSNDGTKQTTFSSMRGNFCGTSNGIDSHPNRDCGISIEWGTNNSIVGGKNLSDANIVMNEKIGVWVAGNNASSAKDTIQGNLIANCSTTGVAVYNNSSNIRILDNIITSSGYGVHFTSTNATPIVSGNKIIKNTTNGVLVDGLITNVSFLNNQIDSTVSGDGLKVNKAITNLVARGNSFSNNSGNGINFVKGTQSIIGGTGANEGNIIAANGGSGINLTDATVTNVQMRRNSISCNAVTGINLNGLANANYMTDVVKVDTINSTSTTLVGQLKGQAVNGVIIEVFAKDNSLCRQSCLSAVERQGYLFIAEGVTDAQGKFNITLPSPVSSFSNITVTATSPGAGNTVGAYQTSEFSRCLEILPVSFLNVSAKNITSGVLVKWQTASETNNDYFVVERSTDGRNFEVISSQIDGAGTTNNINSYTFIDKNPKEGVNYYRIKQVDFDAKFDYSKVVAVNTGGSTIISISPNPTANDAILKILAEESGIYQVAIYDALGKVYFTTSVEVYGGSGEYKLNLNNLSKGVYFLHVTSENTTWIEKLVKE